jgi:hypothetical protein
MIKFSQYECGSILSSGLFNIDWEELRISLKEAASISWGKNHAYTDYAANPTDQISYTFTWS